MTTINPRTGRTLDNIVDSIGSCKVRCGLCSFWPKPCDECAILTKLANWHSDQQERKWQRDLAKIRARKTRKQ